MRKVILSVIATLLTATSIWFVPVVEKQSVELPKLPDRMAVFKVAKNEKDQLPQNPAPKEDPKPEVKPVEQPKQVVSRGGTTFRYKKVIGIVATAYTYTGNRTYTGTNPKRGTISVDPKLIPLGSKVYIEGYGYGVAEDTGGAIHGNIVDLFMTTKSECIKWGRQHVNLYILED